MKDRAAGVITAVFGPLVQVQIDEETLVLPFRRRLTFHGSDDERRLVVGDRVTVDGKPPEMVVTEVERRRTTLTRRSPGEARSKIIAANVDQAVVVLAAVAPEPNPRLLDRLLVACHIAGIEPVICINKIDQGTGGVDTWIGDYQDAGYPIMLVSARTARGMGNVKRAVAGRTTLFCGPSGVGKSALLNAIHRGYRLREGTISEATGKGRHTTTTAQLLPLPNGGFVVDTPGLKEFGFWRLSASELQRHYPEIAALTSGCEYRDCTHHDESGCAVRRAGQSGALSSRRYTSFLKLYDELAADHPQ